LLRSNQISIIYFKRLISNLNLPLTFRDLRVLRQIADPYQKGKVELNIFIPRLDNDKLKSLRLNKTLNKLTIVFYTNNFDLEKAFRSFDHKNTKEVN
jgi:hypothetical protein